MMTNAKHSSASALWYTPPDYIEAAREVLGVIEFDPASDEEANKTVRAELYFSERGEDWSRWPGDSSIWLNPPGGRSLVGGSWQGAFWWALMAFARRKQLRHAIFMAFSIESFQVTQGKEYPCGGGWAPEPCMLEFPICVPAKRIRFISPSGSKDRPTHASSLVYVPGSVDRTDDFIRVFSRFGACKR